MGVAIVTNVRHYAGAGAVEALAAAGHTVVCQDRAFSDAAARVELESGEGSLAATAERDPTALVEGILAEHGRVDVLVSNDYVPGESWSPLPEPADPDLPVMRRVAVDELGVEDFRATLEQLVVKPFELCRAVLPSMKQRESGCIVLITSAVSYRANPWGEAYSSGRSAATSLAQGIAWEAAPYKIQVNPIGPSWFDNPTYYPQRDRDRFWPVVERKVPTGRLGSQSEMGALISYLASGEALPVTGQFIPFSSGTRLGAA